MVSADYIQQGLVQRGLPAHIAQGFVMNMRDESGLNPGINERAPLVHGSRGGYGLYQLTGPRRRAYESYASSRGVSFDNADAQLDFLMSELQGPEKRAAQSIFSTDNPQDAAVAIARDFLRPAASNLQKRVASYTGNKDPQAAVSTKGTAPMMQQEEETPRGFLGGLGIQKMQEGAPGETGQRFYERDSFKDTAALLAQGFGRMGIMGMEEIADGIAKQRTEAKARNKTVEYLRKSGRNDLADAVESGSLGARDAAGIMFSKPKDDRTAAMQNFSEYQRILAEQGEEAAEQFRAMSKGGPTINMGDVGQGDYLYGTKAGLQSGYRLNVKTGEASAIPGGPADTAAQDAKAEDAGLGTQATAGSTVLGDIAEMKRRVEESPTLTTGFIGGLLKNYGGTGALDVNELGKTIRANIGFDRLQRMRDESPTGGALGQVAVQELEALQASLGSLNTSQGAPQLIRNLERLETQYRKSMQRILNTEGGAKYFTQSEANLIQNAPQGSSQTKTGITYKVLD